MTTGREGHTATLLLSGNVLIAGGTDGRGKALASAEVYNPATNTWTAAGSMATTRPGHTATLLPNGKVLVAGGFDGLFPANTLPTTELYDPTTNSWSSAAPMIGSRSRHMATLLLDGQVLVAGGLSVTLRGGGYYPSKPASAEIYDPKANLWSATGPMVSFRQGQTATLLTDGRALIAGGWDVSILNSTEIYDPTKGQWIAAAPMATGRGGHTATLLANGAVLVVGGIGSESSAQDSPNIWLSSAEIYNPPVNRWSTVASTVGERVEHTSTLLRNGMVLVVGNTGRRSRPELYDPASNTWSRTGPSMERYNHSATRLPDGAVLIVGGYGIESLHSVLRYDPTAIPPVPRQPVDPRLIAVLLLAAFLVIAGVALSIPSVRRRLRSWRPHHDPDEWIT